VAASSSAPSRPASGQATGRIACRLARDAVELAEHFAVRHHVFVETQALFAADDRDERDSAPGTLHAVGLCDGHVAGAVRLYPLDANALWKGDRLAVLPADRFQRLGAMLVEFAVATAGERGGQRMVAQIQLPNVRFFERLGWRAYAEPAPFHGRVHQPMAIALTSPQGP
jgi:putative N-acetyltransferase (TIGR04045 family)